MIAWVDDWLKLWAAEVRGGLPGRSTVDVGDAIEFQSMAISGMMSHDAWQMECAVQKLEVRLRGVVKIHYLPQHNSTRDRVQAAARLLGDKAPRVRGAACGTAAYREQLEPTLARQQARYYRLLNDAHVVIADRLRAHHQAG